jgi:predicted Ser/Thr protein kinase
MASGPSRAPRPTPRDTTQPGALSEGGPLAPVILGPGERVEAVGPYRVLGPLGRGGMGIVYEVRRDDAGPVYALKTIEARFLALEDGNADRRFNHEIHVMAKLAHPGVVRLFEYGFARHPMGYDLAYFVMERLHGHGLDERLTTGPRFTPQEAVRCALEVTDALVYLEANGILHRDIKPANLFVHEDGRVVLMDFGLARSAELTRLTRAGHVIGTLPYMSPEALRAEETTSAVDVYALGAVLFELLTGDYPFLAKDPTELVRQIHKGVRWPEAVRFSGAEVQVRELVTHMLHADPKVRPSPKEVAMRATAILRSLGPGGAPAPQPETRSMVAAAAPVSAPAAEPPRAVSIEASQAALSVSAARPLAPPPGRPGPTWPVALGLAGLCSGVAFALGVMVTYARVAPPPAPVAPPPRAAAPPPATPRPEAPPTAPDDAPPVSPEPEVPSFASAQDAFRWGDQALKDGHYRAAIAALDETLQLNPAFARAHRRLGDAYLSLGELKDALRHYKTYRALRPSAPDAQQVAELIDKVSR